MEEGCSLCGKVTEEDIEKYAEMMACLELGRDNLAGGYKKPLSKYGKDVKEIQETMKKHLAECFLCCDLYEDTYEIALEIHTIAMNLSHTQDCNKKEKEWGIEHLAYEDPESLDAYMLKRAIAEADKTEFEKNKDFEEHLKSCNSCKSLYDDHLKLCLETVEMRKQKD
jgi:hypothetical protein